MTDCMLSLEKDPAAVEHLTEMFRAAHSLKGMSGTMGYELIMELTHEMESLWTSCAREILPWRQGWSICFLKQSTWSS